MTAENEQADLRANALLASAHVVVSVVVLFVLFRFVVSTLGVEAIGLWSLVMAISTAVRLGELGLGASNIRFVAMHLARDKKEDAASAVATATLSVATLVSVLCVVAWPVLNWALPLITTSPDDLTGARALLPYAVASIWLAAVSNSITTALVGCHRADLASLIQMGAQVLWLVAGLFLVPRMGLQGLALGYAFQYLCLAAVGWLLLSRQLPTLRGRLPRWSRTRFLEMWRYGATQQLVSLASLLGEPLAKVLLGHFGTLSMLGFFEMANRLVAHARMLLVAANRVLVPHFTKLAETTSEGFTGTYIRNVRVVTLVGSILFSLLGAVLPLISVIWIGHYEPEFVTFGLLLSFGWFVNLLSVPAFFANAGTGRLRINLAGQVTVTAVMCVVGISAGILWGGMGTALAWPAGLVAGTVMIIAANHRHDRVGVASTFGRDSGMAVLTGCTVVAVGGVIFWSLWPGQGLLIMFSVIGGIGVLGWAAFFVVMPRSWHLMTQITNPSARFLTGRRPARA